MKTYIRLIFNSRGSRPSEVFNALRQLNFMPTIGEYDFVFDWGEGNEPEPREIVSKVDAVHNALRGHDVTYEITTSDPMYHIKEVSAGAAPATTAPRTAAATTRPTAAPRQAAAPRAAATRPAAARQAAPQRAAPRQAAPGAAAQKPKCAQCSRPATYINKYKRWYCHPCKRYL